ncbi:hypothetical protein [Aurantimonas coralicida]|uniref:hypothetical protein n=1 Tax=Aurantimonas coralicida TaxID=182270 RepID=UPI001E2AEB30|nr:hypothetical protein [Aurantimonas coralicida]MCD1642048.1 hypothetical protein [Aurantimonas coralicida]
MRRTHHDTHARWFWVSAIAALILGELAVAAVAGGREPLVGPHPWDFPERNRETAFAYQYARDNRGSAAGAAGVAGAFGSPVIINSTSTAVGNWQQIEMTLGDGAEGLIMTENHQNNDGDAQATSNVMDEGEQNLANGNSWIGE